MPAASRSASMPSRPGHRHPRPQDTGQRPLPAPVPRPAVAAARAARRDRRGGRGARRPVRPVERAAARQGRDVARVDDVDSRSRERAAAPGPTRCTPAAASSWSTSRRRTPSSRLVQRLPDAILEATLVDVSEEATMSGWDEPQEPATKRTGGGAAAADGGAAAVVADEPTHETDAAAEAAYLAATDWLTRQRRATVDRATRAVARALLDALGAPDPPRVLHVVGTNGKGTVAHLLAAMAQAHGLRTGRFTSPHVEDLRERVAIDGAPISRAEVTASSPAPAAWAAGHRLLRVDAGARRRRLPAPRRRAGGGGGGRRRPLRRDHGTAGVVGTVLTNVDLDHVETIGPTLLDVARDKAAVARHGVPLVTGARGEALALVRAAAADVGAPVWVVDAAQPLARWPEGAPVVDATWPPTRVENARTALTLGRLLGWSEAALARGLASPPPPARFERFHLLVDGRPLLGRCSTAPTIRRPRHAAGRGAHPGLRPAVRQPRPQTRARQPRAAAIPRRLGVVDQRRTGRGAAHGARQRRSRHDGRARARGGRSRRRPATPPTAARCWSSPARCTSRATPGPGCGARGGGRRRRQRAGAGCYAHRPMGRVGFVSLGCPKALVDSERILTELRAEGYDLVRSYEEADVVVVNTCGFITPAVEESLAAIGEALDRERPRDRHRLPGRAPRGDPRAPPERAGRDRPGRRRGGDGRRPNRAAPRRARLRGPAPPGERRPRRRSAAASS
jgi:dihydrofolate synthase / folylpolyglutamate synthase